MGLLIDGVWHDEWYDTAKSGGRFQRSESRFRNWVTPDGRPGPTGMGGFAAEPGRYHLYISRACPWRPWGSRPVRLSLWGSWMAKAAGATCSTAPPVLSRSACVPDKPSTRLWRWRRSYRRDLGNLRANGPLCWSWRDKATASRPP